VRGWAPLVKATTEMTIEHVEGPLPSSAPLERDARLVSTDQNVAPSEIAIGVIIGRAAEYFDFFVFAIASVVVFPKVFFPFAEPVTATLYSFAIFSLAFVARPIGSAIFTGIDRRHGRGVKLTVALFLLGTSTMAVSFLPEYEQIGAASIYLLAVLRIGQGLALGGAWDGLASLLALNAPVERRGLYAAIAQLGAPLGFIVAAVLFSFFLLNLSESDFLDWGWRYPFFCAFAINVVAVFSRLRLVVTDEFASLLQRGRLEPSPILPLIRNQSRELLIGALVPLASFALFHLVTVFPISWITLFTHRSAGEFLMVQSSGAFICAGAIVASGLIADQIGRRMLLLISTGLIAVFAICSTIAPLIVEENAIGQTIYVNAGFALLGLSYGQSSGAVTSRLDRRFRYTGAALTSDFAWFFGAGFAPLIVLFLSARYGLACVGLYLLSGAVTTFLALAVSRSEIRQV
jgi:MFS family permease